jgi:hypothetical protein
VCFASPLTTPQLTVLMWGGAEIGQFVDALAGG